MGGAQVFSWAQKEGSLWEDYGCQLRSKASPKGKDCPIERGGGDVGETQLLSSTSVPFEGEGDEEGTL